MVTYILKELLQAQVNVFFLHFLPMFPNFFVVKETLKYVKILSHTHLTGCPQLPVRRAR